jgi:hypothetical protein
VQRLEDRLTVHLVPMLNPDGAQRFVRRNAQGIDINRDALHLQTPEGRALKALRDRLQPVLGFNLHNQNGQTSAGSPPKPATISLLAVAHDAARSDSPRRTLAKQTAALVREALEPLIPGQVGRYSDEFEVRASATTSVAGGPRSCSSKAVRWPVPMPTRAGAPELRGAGHRAGRRPRGGRPRTRPRPTTPCPSTSRTCSRSASATRPSPPVPAWPPSSATSG